MKKKGIDMSSAPAAGAPLLVMNAQYVKDSSFENPKAPASLFGIKDKPAIDLSVDIQSQRVQEKAYEVVLHIAAKASVPSMPLFLADLTYAGVFTVTRELEKQVLQELLLVEGPTLLFPFARRIIADLSRDGGFPPLMLEPIDFRALYAQRQKETQKAEAVN